MAYRKFILLYEHGLYFERGALHIRPII